MRESVKKKKTAGVAVFFVACFTVPAESPEITFSLHPYA
jgi:hypothetical protein